jgi:hypothetical protein
MLSSKAAPAGMPPDGGGTGPNKLLSEREVVDGAVIGGFFLGGGDEGIVVTVAG